MKKKTLNIIFWAVCIPLIITLLSFVGKENKRKQCRDFRVAIDYQGQDFLFTADEIESQVLSKFDSLEGMLVKQVEEADIEAEIEKNPYVLNAEVYTTIDGSCVAEVWQRKPIMQLIDRKGKSMYVDVDGVLMPDDQELPARVPVANGYFNLDSIHPAIEDIKIADLDRKELSGLFKIARKVYKDKLLKAAVEQVYLNREGQYELITKLGQHSVLLGEAKALDEKLAKLKVFYQEALERGGWASYKQLNLVYENQVVCNKK
jgi:cell division protein FtsQ